MSYLTELVNQSQNERNVFINFSKNDETVLKSYSKGKNENEIIQIIETIW
tara:strand:+ start:7744 stop:7893 length:150 start_codon:yes stop_codon:yes gene_type:complete